VNNRRLSWVTALSASFLLVACGGGEVPEGGTPPIDAAPAIPAEPAEDQGEEAQATVLQREVFQYQGARRDPFASLLRTGDVRPLLEDLRITAINYDNQFPMNSVAVISDTTERKRYAVRVGDQLGRLRVSSIREREVVLAYEEFGRELQDTLRMRRNQEGSQ
jgi:hypothetical protein